MEKKHLLRFHEITGIDGIFVDENLIGKTALCDAFSNFNMKHMTLYVVENVGISLCISEER
jgi:hypothetical protein